MGENYVPNTVNVGVTNARDILNLKQYRTRVNSLYLATSQLLLFWCPVKASN